MAGRQCHRAPAESPVETEADVQAAVEGQAQEPASKEIAEAYRTVTLSKRARASDELSWLVSASPM
jgi:hypothetical protein